MIAGLKPYPAMRDSGVPWLGQVPKHWEVTRARYLFREVDRRSQTGSETHLSMSQKLGLVPSSMVEQRTLVSESYVGGKLCEPDDLVLNRLKAHLGVFARARQAGVISPDYTVLRPRRALEVRYFEETLRSSACRSELRVRAKGIVEGFWRLYTDDFYDIRLCVPPHDEHIAIVRFLDYADRRIRRYIHAKQKLIKLLEEQKQAIIHQAVTRGLNPNVRLKPSGVDWLGEVPEHWGVKRVKQASQILRGKFTHRPRNDPSLYDGPYPFIQTGEVARASKTITSYRQTLNERGLAVSKMFPTGTLVMTIAANIGDVAVLDFEACFPDSVVGFVPRNGVVRDYLYFVFRAMKQELLREAPVNTQGNLNVDRIGSRGIALPPTPEQHAIVRHIEEQTLSLNRAIDHAHREITLLREYRTRLIADVVTGKLDVREAAASLPDETDEPEARDDSEVLTEDEDNIADSDLDVAPEETEA